MKQDEALRQRVCETVVALVWMTAAEQQEYRRLERGGRVGMIKRDIPAALSRPREFLEEDGGPEAEKLWRLINRRRSTSELALRARPVIWAAAKRVGALPSDLTGHWKPENVVWARWVAAYVLREDWAFSPEDVGLIHAPRSLDDPLRSGADG